MGDSWLMTITDGEKGVGGKGGSNDGAVCIYLSGYLPNLCLVVQLPCVMAVYVELVSDLK